ncbi:uncharacterized protein METZ01_LOCUS241912 [marine metagenome]|uniref:Lipocalin-like domain-containing protein n=1 Tax=marine metagenome TaxID=408172 RepID=A0A382HP31_9ZZZZ|tara:strand:+ start:206 stop:661 length:456 start_codon:yes stop_codon:yes gene_type:complete
MNKIFLILTLLFVSTIQSQNIERNDLIGEWVFKVNIKDAIKNSKDLNGFEKLAARTFSGYIEKALEKTQMIFDFKNDNTASVTIITEEKTEGKNVFYWKINEEGHLLLDEINDQQDIEFGDTAYWVFDDDKLVPYDIEANINEGMLMIKVN